MYGFSAVDGFMTVNENLEDMIKYLANEPSVGLYFVQQHAQNAMPNLLNLKDRVVGKSREIVFHTEDMEDSIQAVRSMADYGVPIIDEMINDINKSLHLMSISTPKRGLTQSSRFGRSSSQPVLASNHGMESSRSDSGNGRGYFKSVFSSAKQKASGLRWSTLDSTSQHYDLEGAIPPTHPQPMPKIDIPSYCGDELPVSDVNGSSRPVEQDGRTMTSSTDDLLVKYEQFQSEREVKLEEWLQESEERMCV